MKRVLSLVLALVMVLGMIPMGFAAEATAGQTLKGYGIIEGYEDGSLGEDKNLNRAEMMVVLARMMGKGAEAEAFALPSTFTDLEGFGWAVPWIAYAEMNEWTAGVGANMYDPAGNVTAQQAAVFMLKALGYEADVDFNWTNAVEFATAKGLFAGVDTAATSPILRGDLFTMMITTLNTEVKDGSALLGVKLGYMEVAELEVVSVKALNLVQVEVKFNKAVDADSAEDIDNYELTDADGDDLLADWDEESVEFDLQADGKTLVISHLKADLVGTDPEIEQQTEAILEIDGVKSADKKLVIDNFVSEVFEYMDTTIPKALKAEVIGNDTIKVYFSEPINGISADDFEVDGGDYVVNDDKTVLVNNNTEANVALYSVLEEGKVTIQVSGMDDYAGFNVVKTTFEINVVEDKEAPYVVGYKDAKPTGVTLIFNEDVRGLFDNDDIGITLDDQIKYFYHTNTSNYATSYEIDGKNLKLKFADESDSRKLPEGTAYVYVAKEAVEDYWENANNKLVFKVEVEVDNVAPVLNTIEVDLNDNDQVELTLTFSEEIEAGFDEDDAFLIIDEDGDEVGFTLVEHDEDEIVLRLNGDADDLAGKYKITIQDLEDTANNEIVKVTKEFTIDDLVAPVIKDDFTATLYNQAAKNQLVKIDFGEKMSTTGAYSVLDPDKYIIDGWELGDFDVTPTIKLVDDGKAIEIYIASKADNSKDGKDLVPNVWVDIARVADAAGNKTKELSGTINLRPASSVAIDTVKVTGKNTIVIEFEDRLTTFKSGDLEFYVDSTTPSVLTPSRISTSLNSDGYTVVTYKVTQDIDFDGTIDGNGIYLNIVGQESKNIYGEKIDNVSADQLAEDKYAPEVAKYDGGDNDGKYMVEFDAEYEYVYENTTYSAIKIFFTEKLETTSVSRLSFSVEGETVKAVTFEDSDYGDDSVVVLLFVADIDTKAKPKVTQEFSIADFAGNKYNVGTTLYSIIADWDM